MVFVSLRIDKAVKQKTHQYKTNAKRAVIEEAPFDFACIEDD